METGSIEFKREDVKVVEVEAFQNPFCLFMCESRTETSCPFIETRKCDPNPRDERELEIMEMKARMREGDGR